MINYVLLHTFKYQHEAELIYNVLEQNGIDAYYQELAFNDTWDVKLYPTELFVEENRFEEAKKILNEYKDIFDDKDPQTSSQNIAVRNENEMPKLTKYFILIGLLAVFIYLVTIIPWDRVFPNKHSDFKNRIYHITHIERKSDNLVKKIQASIQFHENYIEFPSSFEIEGDATWILFNDSLLISVEDQTDNIFHDNFYVTYDEENFIFNSPYTSIKGWWEEIPF